MKVLKDDVSNANSISFMDLGYEIESLTSAVDSFLIDAKSKLSGEYTTLVNTINGLNDGLKKYANYIQNFDKAIIGATNSMSKYMNPYDELDDSTKNYVHTLIDGLHRTNNGLEWQINHPGTDSEGNPKKINVGALRARIEENNSEIEELNKKYKLLEGLAAEDSKDAAMINQHFSKDNLAAFSLSSETFNFN